MTEIFAFFERLIALFLPFCLLVVVGGYLSHKMWFFQVKGLFRSFAMVRAAFRGRNSKNFSSYSSVCTGLSATVGTGNIAGVAGAVSLGGPGAVFWMWVSAFFAMAIKYFEIYFSVKHRREEESEFFSGPMHYIKNGLSPKWQFLSAIFSVLLLLSGFTTGNLTQINSVVSCLDFSVFVRALIGLIFAVLVYFSISGSTQKIGALCEKIVPVMSIFYIAFCVIVISLNIKNLPAVIKNIFIGAFNPRAVCGGAVGSVITTFTIGASRGVFSNEAGMGTAGIIYAKPKDIDEKTQGYFGIFEVFLDTILLCTLTALTILSSSVKINFGKPASSELLSASMSGVFGSFSGVILFIMMAFFGFSSVLGWSVYAKEALHFLKIDKLWKYFSFIFCLCCVLGAVLDIGFAFRTAEFTNGIMLILNLPILLILFKGENDGKYKGNNENA